MYIGKHICLVEVHVITTYNSSNRITQLGFNIAAILIQNQSKA